MNWFSWSSAWAGILHVTAVLPRSQWILWIGLAVALGLGAAAIDILS